MSWMLVSLLTVVTWLSVVCSTSTSPSSPPSTPPSTAYYPNEDWHISSPVEHGGRWFFRNSESCLSLTEEVSLQYIVEGAIHCPAVWDSIMCWPAVRANSIATARCPPLPSLNTRNFASRLCGPTGQWLDRHNTVDLMNPKGWTNYGPCFERPRLNY